MFTTVTMDKSLMQLVFLRQCFGNLRTAAPHAMLIGADKRTCDAARNAKEDVTRAIKAFTSPRREGAGDEGSPCARLVLANATSSGADLKREAAPSR